MRFFHVFLEVTFFLLIPNCGIPYLPPYFLHRDLFLRFIMNICINCFDNHLNNCSRTTFASSCEICGSFDNVMSCSCGVFTAQDILSSILKTMEVPPDRFTDMGWLMRNLSIRNSNHPKFVHAKILIRRISS